MDRTDNVILREKFGSDMPSVTDIAKKISLLLVNTHYSLSGPRALSPKVIEVGGVHIKEPKPIDEVSDDKLSFEYYLCIAYTVIVAFCHT